MKTVLATLITAAIVGLFAAFIAWPMFGFLVFLLIVIGLVIATTWRIIYDLLADVLQ